MHNFLEQLQAELPDAFHAKPPLGVSPTLYRNWCLGRSIQTAHAALPEQHGFFEQANKLLIDTPVQGMAATLARFYSLYPAIEALHPRLSWAHFQALLGLYDTAVRDFYLRCALAGHWTAGELRRQIQSHWHLRRSMHLDAPVRAPTHGILPPWLPNPLVLDFVPAGEYADEAELEAAIVDHLAVFLLELGQGLSFVARQMRLRTFSGLQVVVDLVFYHHRERHFVLFELKNTPLTAAAVGQLQCYLQVFDDCWKNPDDGPSVGVILCTEVDPALQRYTALHQSAQLFAVSFVPELPLNGIESTH